MTSGAGAGQSVTKLVSKKYLTERDMERLREFYGKSLLYCLQHIRSRRFGLGYEGDTGRTETRQGYKVTYAEGAMPYKSNKKPIPLTELETALLCWCACGLTGKAVGDVPHGEGLSTVLYMTGRTVPGPCNDCALDLIYINDDGVFFYKRAEPMKAVEFQSEDDWYKIMKLYRENSVKLMDGRPELYLDWPAIWRWNTNINRPGSTMFLPIYDVSREWVNLMLHLFEYEKSCFLDPKTGEICDKTGVVQQKIEDGTITGMPIPLNIYHLYQIAGTVSGACMQNVRLAAEAMGLGCWVYSGFDANTLFGCYQDYGYGKGMLDTGAILKAFPDQAWPWLMGIKKVKEAYEPPFYKSMKDALEAIWDLKYGPDGVFAKLRKAGKEPWNPETVKKILEHEKTYTPQWCKDCTISTMEYVWEKYERLPTDFQPMVMCILMQVHHLDLDFYKKYYQPEYITPFIKDHFKLWHE